MSKETLKTFTMKVLIVDNHTTNIKKLIELFPDQYVCDCVNRDEFNSEITATFDMVVFSGGSNVRSVKNHSEVYKKQIEFIQNTSKPIIGICLGCEIIAFSFDCVIQEFPNPIKGVYPIEFGNTNLKVFESHRFGIQSLSDQIDLLAFSVNGPEVIKHKNKEIYGLQFHPELSVENTDGKSIFLQILNSIKNKLSS